MKLALVLACLLAASGLASAHRSLLAPCAAVTSGAAPSGNTFFVLNCPVLGTGARQACINYGTSIGTTLQLANVAQRDREFIAALIWSGTGGSNAAWVNTAPNYETPFDIPGRPSAGPVGRNYLTLKPLNAAGTNFVTNPAPSFPTKKGNPNQSLAVVCGPGGPSAQPPPGTCASPDPEFLGWVITLASSGPNDAASALCPPGYTLGDVDLNNIYKKADPKLPNPKNPHDGTGFPYLPDLVALCAPGSRVWANTAPTFTTPGLCVSIDGSTSGGLGDPALGGDPTGARAVLVGGLGTADPLCSATYQALCFSATPI